eukprot:3209620-Amphidinium_carterae.1
MVGSSVLLPRTTQKAMMRTASEHACVSSGCSFILIRSGGNHSCVVLDCRTLVHRVKFALGMHHVCAEGTDGYRKGGYHRVQ